MQKENKSEIVATKHVKVRDHQFAFSQMAIQYLFVQVNITVQRYK